MYKAGHLLRRSSVRLKSISKGHTNLQMVISQLREVRSTFKAFVTAQSTLSEDLVRWSSTVENEALHDAFINLAELNSLWTETQKDFTDSLKQFRCHFDLVLEGERHVDQAKQNYAAREESEKNIRKELQKAYNKAPSEEIQLLRERLNKAEKAKELAHLDVVDRVRENEAVRMIRLKEGILNLGAAYVQMSHKASIIFGSQLKVGNEIPDVDDKAIQTAKYRGTTVGLHHVDEARAQLRSYSAAPLQPRRHSSYHDPPPPYSPSRERLNDISKDLSRTSLREGDAEGGNPSLHFHHPSAPSQSMNSLHQSPSSVNPYPLLSPSPENGETRWEPAGAVSPSSGCDDSLVLNSSTSSSAAEGPKHQHRHRRSFHWRKRNRKRAEDQREKSSPQTPPSESLPLRSSPPPYNPFYEWSRFPKSND